MNNKLRYGIIMAIGVIMNQLFYVLADILNLPVWLDVCGTAFVAFTLEPTAGLIVGLINNFYLALFAYDKSTLIYYCISAAIALIAGCMLKKNGKLIKGRIIPAILLATFVSTVLSYLLALWRSGGIPDVGWEFTAYQYALNMGLPVPLASFGGTLFIKILDSFVSAALAAGVYMLLPKKLREAPGKISSKIRQG